MHWKGLFAAIFLNRESWYNMTQTLLIGYGALYLAPWSSPWFLAVFALSYAVYYWVVCCPPLRIFGNGGAPWQNAVLLHMPCLKLRGFYPTWYMTNGSIQTLFAAFLRADPKVSFAREKIEGVYEDGEVMVLDWSYAVAERSADNLSQYGKSSTPTWVQGGAFPGTAKGGGSPRSGRRAVTPTRGNQQQQQQQEFPTAASNGHKSDVKELPPVIIVFHGLTGGTDDATIHYLAKGLNKAGFHVVVPVRAGCGPLGTIKKAKHYAYGDVDNVVHMVDYLAGRLKGRRLYGVGISAGSNVMCNYLGITGTHAKLSGGISIANGFEWDDGTAAIAKYHPVWDVVMCAVVSSNLFHRHASVYEVEDAEAELEAEGAQQQKRRGINGNGCVTPNKNGMYDGGDGKDSTSVGSTSSGGSPFALPKPKELRPQTSLRHYDDAVSRQLHGFSSLQEFYKHQSCVYRLHNIRRPVLFMNCQDDPLSHHSLWPMDEIMKNNNLVLVATEKGGHLGWIDGLFPVLSTKPSFLDRFIIDGIQGMVAQPNPVTKS